MGQEQDATGTGLEQEWERWEIPALPWKLIYQSQIVIFYNNSVKTIECLHTKSASQPLVNPRCERDRTGIDGTQSPFHSLDGEKLLIINVLLYFFMFWWNGRKTKSGYFLTKIAIRHNSPHFPEPTVNLRSNPDNPWFFNGLVWANLMRALTLVSNPRNCHSPV